MAQKSPQLRGLFCSLVRLGSGQRQRPNHSHSIINKPPKPAWLKGLAVIDMGPYRRFYRQKRTSFAGAGDGAICGRATLATPSSSINWKDTGSGASSACVSRSGRQVKRLLCALPVLPQADDRPASHPGSAGSARSARDQPTPASQHRTVQTAALRRLRAALQEGWPGFAPNSPKCN